MPALQSLSFPSGIQYIVLISHKNVKFVVLLPPIIDIIYDIAVNGKNPELLLKFLVMKV